MQGVRPRNQLCLNQVTLVSYHGVLLHLGIQPRLDQLPHRLAAGI